MLDISQYRRQNSFLWLVLSIFIFGGVIMYNVNSYKIRKIEMYIEGEAKTRHIETSELVDAMKEAHPEIIIGE